MRNDIADDDIQTERHADERADTLPLTDEDDGKGKDHGQPQDRRRSDIIHEIGIDHIFRRLADGDEDFIAGSQEVVVRTHLTPAVIYFHHDAFVLTLQNIHPRNLIGLQIPAQIQFTLLDDLRHLRADRIRAEGGKAFTGQLHLG